MVFLHVGSHITVFLAGASSKKGQHLGATLVVAAKASGPRIHHE